MGRVANEIIRAAAHLGFEVERLTPLEVKQLWSTVESKYGYPSAQSFPWDSFHHERASVRDEQAWRKVGKYVGDRECVLLTCPNDEYTGFRLQSGSQLHRILEETFGFEFFLSDHETTFVLCCNHHDYLIASGEARAWLLATSPVRTDE